jgi:tRNA(Arg) A34 adenosine deaminase TadA
MTINHEAYMLEAITLSIESVHEGGGPFGAVIVDSKTGAVIGRGKNRVTLHNDPTAHGEVEAIRHAAKNTGRTELSECILYTSAEPCPGCFFESVFNAGIKEIYFGNSVAAAAEIGFADDKNWALLLTTPATVMKKVGGTIEQLLQEKALEGFVAWKNKKDKVEYYSK